MTSNSLQKTEDSITVLYIEDDHFNRQLVRLILEQKDNINLLEAETGAEGLHCFSEHHPDIVFLDLSLPDSSGYEILEKIKAEMDTKSVPVIAVSGDSHPDDISRGLKAGFQGYITKPINIDDLFKVLDTAIASLAE